MFSHRVSKNLWMNWNKKKNDGLFLNMPWERTKAQMRTRVGQTFPSRSVLIPCSLDCNQNHSKMQINKIPQKPAELVLKDLG